MGAGYGMEGDMDEQARFGNKHFDTKLTNDVSIYLFTDGG
jgi:hypothetical protein